jgi:uncharacterized protein (DUF488 family)
VRIFTIGFTKKPAEAFFAAVRGSGAMRLLDVRLNNVSQLAGFAKRDDLRYFLREICDIDYHHVPALAPTQDMLDRYKKKGGEWSVYEREFLDLMKTRGIEGSLDRALLADSCLLCSEDNPRHCHRRLVVEYLQEHWGHIDVVHLGVTTHGSRNS